MMEREANKVPAERNQTAPRVDASLAADPITTDPVPPAAPVAAKLPTTDQPDAEGVRSDAKPQAQMAHAAESETDTATSESSPPNGAAPNTTRIPRV